MIRHGTTAASREGRFQGRLDFPLSPRGKQEAELLARRLSSTGLEMILSSDLRRAWATARIIAAAAGLQPVRMKLLRECSWGAVEGMTLQEIKDCYPGLFRETGRGIRAGIFGGERERRLLARARMVLGIIEQRYSRLRCIALVSHGRFLNALFAAGLGLRAKQRWPFAPAPASLSLIVFDPEQGQYRLELFNDRCHLQHDAVFDG